MFKIGNLAEFQRGLTDWLVAAEQTAIEVYRGLAAYAFAYIVEETPQYTGETVSNWRISVRMPIYSSNSGIKDARGVAGKQYRGLPVYQKQGWTGGAPDAQPVGQGGNAEAMARARDSLREGFAAVSSLSDKIYITNATAFRTGDKTVADLEQAPSWLREVNKPGHMIARATAYIMDNFSAINASNLKRLMVTPA